jgi:hypothetical protein
MGNRINIDLFKAEYSKIEIKLNAISNITKRWGDGESFEGIEIEDEGILYKTSTSYSGCSTDYYSFYVSWEEINNPIEYFKDKYQKEIDNEANRLKNLKEINEAQIKETEVKKLKELMEKYKEEIKWD